MIRVLLASEDQSLQAELMRQARHLDIRVIPASPHNALELARSLAPEFVILDSDPRVDSRLLLARLKQDVRTCGLRVAMLSNTRDEKLHRFCRELRALHLQEKPLPADYLETLVNVRASSGWVALRSA
ncbi:MAG: hypothetical protein ACJ790_13980 [Myxococcaceae bacterium]